MAPLLVVRLVTMAAEVLQLDAVSIPSSVLVDVQAPSRYHLSSCLSACLPGCLAAWHFCCWFHVQPDRNFSLSSHCQAALVVVTSLVLFGSNTCQDVDGFRDAMLAVVLGAYALFAVCLLYHSFDFSRVFSLQRISLWPYFLHRILISCIQIRGLRWFLDYNPLGGQPIAEVRAALLRGPRLLLRAVVVSSAHRGPPADRPDSIPDHDQVGRESSVQLWLRRAQIAFCCSGAAPSELKVRTHVAPYTQWLWSA